MSICDSNDDGSSNSINFIIVNKLYSILSPKVRIY